MVFLCSFFYIRMPKQTNFHSTILIFLFEKDGSMYLCLLFSSKFAHGFQIAFNIIISVKYEYLIRSIQGGWKRGKNRRQLILYCATYAKSLHIHLLAVSLLLIQTNTFAYPLMCITTRRNFIVSQNSQQSVVSCFIHNNTQRKG